MDRAHEHKLMVRAHKHMLIGRAHEHVPMGRAHEHLLVAVTMASVMKMDPKYDQIPAFSKGQIRERAGTPKECQYVSM